MRVFIAGMARSGSMWTYNATRKLLQHAGYTTLPHEIPSNTAPYLKKAFTDKTNDDEIYCVKTHMQLQPNLPETKIINTYRDVRSAMLSYMRFCHCDFFQGLKVAHSMMLCTDYYFDKHLHDILHICYSDIKGRPEAVLLDICNFLELSIEPDAITSLNDALSYEKIKSLTGSLDTVPVNEQGTLLDHDDHLQFETVKNLDGSFRVFDRQTGFQSNHITSKHEEEWKTVLSEAQKEALNQLTEKWLTRYGFPV